MKLLQAITLASALIIPQVTYGNEKLDKYCEAIADVSVSINKNKSKGITLDQAQMINKITLQDTEMVYKMVFVITARIYQDDLSNKEAHSFAKKGCVSYFSRDNPKDRVKPNN